MWVQGNAPSHAFLCKTRELYKAAFICIDTVIGMSSTRVTVVTLWHWEENLKSIFWCIITQKRAHEGTCDGLPRYFCSIHAVTLNNTQDWECFCCHLPRTENAFAVTYPGLRGERWGSTWDLLTLDIQRHQRPLFSQTAPSTSSSLAWK